jgi:hypothetical protein
MANTLSSGVVLARPGPRRFKGTRDSVIPETFVPPYEVHRNFMKHEGDDLIHSTGWCYGAVAYVTCCRVRFGPTLVVYESATCMQCMLCKGCPACVDGYVREETMRLGKWVTKDDRQLYPFEMDDQHLVNAIKKLIRDEEHFKDDWRQWLEVLGVEAQLRGMK